MLTNTLGSVTKVLSRGKYLKWLHYRGVHLQYYPYSDVMLLVTCMYTHLLFLHHIVRMRSCMYASCCAVPIELSPPSHQISTQFVRRYTGMWGASSTKCL